MDPALLSIKPKTPDVPVAKSVESSGSPSLTPTLSPTPSPSPTPSVNLNPPPFPKNTMVPPVSSAPSIAKGTVKVTPHCPLCSGRHRICPMCKRHVQITPHILQHKMYCQCGNTWEEDCPDKEKA